MSLLSIQSNIHNITSDEVDELLNWCSNAEDEGSNYPGMTYEQGIRDALDWLAGFSEAPNSE